NQGKRVAEISEFFWNWLRRVLGDLFARCFGDEAGAIPLTYPIDKEIERSQRKVSMANAGFWLLH
ncbi:hypothetical protein, partial [Moorena sp. SIO4G3]|uniref:hypothetical protein n=1 Tax=Moorena sp. SIO4G3 TaxID=2607821 RepID=UPI0025F88EE9